MKIDLTSFLAFETDVYLFCTNLDGLCIYILGKLCCSI